MPVGVWVPTSSACAMGAGAGGTEHPGWAQGDAGGTKPLFQGCLQAGAVCPGAVQGPGEGELVPEV